MCRSCGGGPPITSRRSIGAPGGGGARACARTRSAKAEGGEGCGEGESTTGTELQCCRVGRACAEACSAKRAD
eukprot:6177173-Pleurochrysis_carterae.AAC.1